MYEVMNGHSVDPAAAQPSPSTGERRVEGIRTRIGGEKSSVWGRVTSFVVWLPVAPPGGAADYVGALTAAVGT